MGSVAKPGLEEGKSETQDSARAEMAGGGRDRLSLLVARVQGLNHQLAMRLTGQSGHRDNCPKGKEFCHIHRSVRANPSLAGN